MQFKSLEALRGIAAVMVVLFHSTFYLTSPSKLVMHSDLFVDFFFVLSGFVMAYAYQDRVVRQVSFKQFFILRLGRLYPLHLFMLLVWLPYIMAKVYLYQKGFGGSDPQLSSNAYTFALNIFFLQGLAPNGQVGWNWPSWSVAVEFYTYLLFYLFIVIESHRKTLIAPLLVSLSAFLLLYQSGPLLEVAWYSIFRCVGGFFAGIFLYRCHQTKPLLTTCTNIQASILEVLSITLMLLSISFYENKPSVFFVLSVLSFMMVIIIFASQSEGIVTNLLNRSLPQYLGKLSYSIYLTHGIILAAASNVIIHLFKFQKQDQFVNAVFFNGSIFLNTVLVLIVIVCSAITFRFVETPWRNKSRRLAHQYL